MKMNCISVCSRSWYWCCHRRGVSKQSYVQAVSYVRRDAVLSGNQRLNFKQMHSLYQRSHSIQFLSSDRFCEDERSEWGVGGVSDGSKAGAWSPSWGLSLTSCCRVCPCVLMQGEWVCVTWCLTSRPGTTSPSPGPQRTGSWSGWTISITTLNILRVSRMRGRSLNGNTSSLSLRR